MIEIERVLSEKLSENSEIDGHDAGSGEMNIFIHTDNPVATFKEVMSALGSRDFWVNARVAYREIANDKYSVLWPEDLTEFKIS